MSDRIFYFVMFWDHENSKLRRFASPKEAGEWILQKAEEVDDRDFRRFEVFKGQELGILPYQKVLKVDLV